MEEDQPREVFEVTCSIYGAMIYTVLASDYDEAYRKSNGIKHDFEDFVTLSESGDAPGQIEWHEGFVERWGWA